MNNTENIEGRLLKPEITKQFREDMHSLLHRCKVVGPIKFEFGDSPLNAATPTQHKLPT